MQTFETLSQQLMLNIASVNMPKIKPETKVLIIKNLKSKSPAEVADIFNVSKRQVERIRKCYQETADVHDRPRLVRPLKTTAQDNCWMVHLTAPGGVDSNDACFIKNCRILARNGLHGRIAAQKPALNKRQLGDRVAYAKAHSLTEGWTAENLIFQMNRQLNSIPSTVNIVNDP